MEGGKINIKTAFFEHFLPIFIGVLLVSCGFLAGWYWKNTTSQPGITVTVAAPVALSEGQKDDRQEKLLAPNALTPQNCAFVASKKGTKYHVGTSRAAGQIKAENLLCFDNKEAAENAGLTPGLLQ